MMREYRGKTKETANLLTLLQQEKVYLPADCGGKGNCGKCRVQFVSGTPGISAADEEIFSSEELKSGWRLACCADVQGEFTIRFSDPEDEIRASASFASGENGFDASEEKTIQKADGQQLRAAVDIGTTTIAAALVDPAGKKVLRTGTSVNHQRAFGADVISRIQAATEGKEKLLTEAVRRDLRGLLTEIGADADRTETVIAGNTTMQHLLLGLPCDTLGMAPYTPVDISLHREKNMLIMPGISTYVGADIVSGIAACGMDVDPQISLLVDLGTNGEMAIGSRDGIWTASTAAGPAFEGGNIRCGMAGVPGAIDTVRIRNGHPEITTIGNRPAAGICGTGVLETVYELLSAGIVDETGRMDEDFEEEGYPLAPHVVFTPKDVREVQLAKAAIRAGMETLMDACGIRPDQIRHLYLAGGFGQKISFQKAAGIGLLPEELLDRTEAVGNSSLAGAVMLAEDPSLAKRFQNIAEQAKEVSLSESTVFTDLYMKHMFFETDDR